MIDAHKRVILSRFKARQIPKGMTHINKTAPYFVEVKSIPFLMCKLFLNSVLIGIVSYYNFRNLIRRHIALL